MKKIAFCALFLIAAACSRAQSVKKITDPKATPGATETLLNNVTDYHLEYKVSADSAKWHKHKFAPQSSVMINNTGYVWLIVKTIHGENDFKLAAHATYRLSISPQQQGRDINFIIDKL